MGVNCSMSRIDCEEEFLETNTVAFVTSSFTRSSRDKYFPKLRFMTIAVAIPLPCVLYARESFRAFDKLQKYEKSFAFGAFAHVYKYQTRSAFLRPQVISSACIFYRGISRTRICKIVLWDNTTLRFISRASKAWVQAAWKSAAT